MWQIPWPIVQIMLADQPRYVSSNEEEEKPIKATKDDMIALFNRINSTQNGRRT